MYIPNTQRCFKYTEMFQIHRDVSNTQYDSNRSMDVHIHIQKCNIYAGEFHGRTHKVQYLRRRVPWTYTYYSTIFPWTYTYTYTRTHTHTHVHINLYLFWIITELLPVSRDLLLTISNYTYRHMMNRNNI